eukprot:6878335-Prymnesium_polylepis.1
MIDNVRRVQNRAHAVHVAHCAVHLSRRAHPLAAGNRPADHAHAPSRARPAYSSPPSRPWLLASLLLRRLALCSSLPLEPASLLCRTLTDGSPRSAKLFRGEDRMCAIVRTECKTHCIEW